MKIKYTGKEVAILKRAQIVCADLALLGCSLADIDELTMFADYRVPQSLVHFGAIEYSPQLLQKLRSDFLFTSGDRQEVRWNVSRKVEWRGERLG